MKTAQDPSFVVDESKPYAELWLGTHPNGMSTVTTSDDQQQSLVEFVASDPNLHCGSSASTDLSFLFKVLSIEKVLSIQAHPDKKLAERLHATSPHVYKDKNHKPEMAIALSQQVKAMCGFRSLQEIARHVEEYPELRALVGQEVADKIIAGADANSDEECYDILQQMFKTYLDCSDECVQTQLTTLLNRLEEMEERSELEQLMLDLSNQFPGDAGIVAPLLFNIVTCQKGEAIFIDANEPHAYISGELIECMACSDNVVRAGLTPKLKDVDTLVEMLTYKSGSPDIYYGTCVDDCTIRYEPPVADFCVEVINVAPGDSYELAAVDSPSLILTLAGSANLLQPSVCSMEVAFGSSAFCSANTTATVVAGTDGVTITRAFTNVFHKSDDDFAF